MLIKVKVFPDSKKDEIIQKDENSFEVSVREKPIMGKANKAVLSLLASFLKIPKHNIKLVKGAEKRNKIFEILGQKW